MSANHKAAPKVWFNAAAASTSLVAPPRSAFTETD